MKSKKLGLFLFIVQFVLCLSLVVTASALESTDSIDVSYSAGAESLAVGTGETVTVNISLDKNAGFIASKVYVVYDTEKLTFEGFEFSDSAFAGEIDAKTLPNGKIQIAIGDIRNANPLVANPPVFENTGCVVDLVFKTTETDFDTATVKVEVSKGNTVPPKESGFDVVHNPYTVAGDTLTLYGPLHQHTAGEWVEDKAASCTEEGSKHQACSICGETVKTETIDMKDHGTVVDAAVAATCTATGLTEGSHCPDCNLVHKAQEVVPMTKHAYNEGVVTTAPTAATEGVKTFTCTACSDSYTEAVAKLAPTMVEAGDKWNKKMETLLVFRTDAAFADFTEVRVNGAVLAAENYTVTDASGIKVELKREYLETLEIGEYTIEVASASGAASASFQIEEAPAESSSLLWLWIVIAVVVVAGAGVAVFFVMKKKKA